MSCKAGASAPAERIGVNIWQLTDEQLAEYAEYLQRHGYGWKGEGDK